MISCFSLAKLARHRVIGRKHAADKSDEGEAKTLIIADAIDIPPGIAARLYRDIKARSEMMALAAIWPESATIGTPAPGCTLPPAI